MVEIKIPKEYFLKNLNFGSNNKLENQKFTFIVKDKSYEVPKENAFLCCVFQNNKDVSTFNVDIDDPQNLFKNIVLLLQGDAIVIKKEEYPFYFQVISLLKIEPVYQQLETLLNEEYQNELVEYCFSNNNTALMNSVFNLKNFDFNLSYNVLF